ncbi:hypothetical protein RFI_03890, partial [Reticulomyxa filosa]
VKKGKKQVFFCVALRVFKNFKEWKLEMRADLCFVIDCTDKEQKCLIIMEEAICLTGQQAKEPTYMRGVIRELTTEAENENKFPSVKEIEDNYKAIGNNDQLNLISEIIKQLRGDEKIKQTKGIKGTFEIAFLARFAHCVSFTILKLSYQFVQSYWDNQLEYLQTLNIYLIKF